MSHGTPTWTGSRPFESRTTRLAYRFNFLLKLLTPAGADKLIAKKAGNLLMLAGAEKKSSYINSSHQISSRRKSKEKISSHAEKISSPTEKISSHAAAGIHRTFYVAKK